MRGRGVRLLHRILPTVLRWFRLLGRRRLVRRTWAPNRSIRRASPRAFTGNPSRAVNVPSASPQAAASAPSEAAQAAAPSVSLEEQPSILEANRSLWEFTEPWESPWFYAFTDLDHNGRQEVIAASTQGTGIFTYAHFYEVKPDFSGIENVYRSDPALEGPDDWPEIVTDALSFYYDAAADRYWYVCEGVTRDGVAHQYYAWYALCLKDGSARWV